MKPRLSRLASHPRTRPIQNKMNGHRHSLRWGLFCVAAGAALAAVCAKAQEPASPAPPPATSQAAAASHPSKKKYSHVNDFLIRGTVFNEKALSLAGVALRVRRAGQKKYRWETYTNSRGEFAVRVPQGSDYEMLVHVKGFVDQTKSVDAKNGGNEETMVFRMEPSAGGR